MSNNPTADATELAHLKKRIAELEANEILLRHEFEHLRQLYDRAPLAYQSLDEQGNFIEVNQAWLDSLGYAREEVIGRNFAEFLHPDWRTHFSENFPRFKAVGEVLGVEFEMARKDGSFFSVSFHGKIGKNPQGQFQQTHCIFQDISERRRAERELLESEHLLNVSQRLTKSGGWQWDVLKQIMTWTEETYRIHDIDPKELTQGSPRHITLSQACYSPEDWTKLLAAFQRCIESGESYDLEFPFTTGKGRKLWIRTTAEAVWAEDRVVRVIGNILDITDRKLIELKLLENETAIRAILDSAPETISVIDTSGTILMANNTMVSRLQRSSEDLIGRNAYDFFPPDVALRRKESVRQVVETGRSVTLVDEREDRALESYLWPVLDDAGHVSKIAVFALDITDRKRNAEHLIIYQNIVSSTQDGIAFIDLHYRYVIVNDAYERFSGVNREKFIGLTVAEYLGEETFQKLIKPHIDKCLQGESVNFQEWFDYPVLGRRFVDVAYYPYIDLLNKAAGVIANTRDITDRKKIEDALRESEERFRNVAGLAPVGIYLTSPDGQCRYANPRWCEMAGMTQEEALGNGWITGLHPDDRDMVCGAWQQMVESEGHWGLEYRFQTPAGKTTWVFGLASAQRDKAGRIIQYIGINTDISERREAEEQIKSLAIFPILNPAPTFRLDDKGVVILANPKAVELGIKPGAGVAELLPITATIDWSTCITSGQKLLLESDIHGSFFQFSIHGESQLGFAQIYGADITERRQAEEALRATLAEKDVLLREVHHRVKNNMAAIIGLFDLQRQAMDDPQTRTVLAELSSRVRAMSLVHEKLYRSESLARIDFQEYIQSLISHLRTSFGSPGIRCEVAALGVAMPLDLAVPCGMIINELVTNALKYAFPQEIPGPSDKGDRILVAMAHDGGTFSLSVADNGVGLPAGFDLSTVKTLGLVLVRMLGQHQLAGRYEVDQVGGTRFKLTFSLRNGRKAHD